MTRWHLSLLATWPAAKISLLGHLAAVNQWTKSCIRQRVLEMLRLDSFPAQIYARFNLIYNPRLQTDSPLALPLHTKHTKHDQAHQAHQGRSPHRPVFSITDRQRLGEPYGQGGLPEGIGTCRDGLHHSPMRSLFFFFNLGPFFIT